MRILLDMNLPPRLVEILSAEGWEAVHWSTIGEPSAPDHILLQWAKTNTYVVLTHDLDFGAILAATKAEGPSVIQVRTQDVFSQRFEDIITSTLREYEELLDEGALVVIDESRARARILPLHG
jgi:predicted nuclease of predicted toxin-antitoxin system